MDALHFKSAVEIAKLIRDRRVSALEVLEHFLARPIPTWGPDLSGLDLNNIYYYIKPAEAQGLGRKVAER